MFEINKLLSDFRSDDILDICYVYTYLQLYIEEYVLNKLIEIGKINKVDEVKKEKSFFDDYDIENGYEECQQEDKNVYEKSIYTINCLIKYAIRELKMSYRNCIKCNLSEMLDYILYNLEYERDNKDNSGSDDGWDEEF